MAAIDQVPDDNIEYELTPDELATANAKKLLKRARKIGKDRGEVASLIITIEKLEKDLEVSESRVANLTAENYDLVERNKELVSVVNAVGGDAPRQVAPVRATPTQVNHKVQLDVDQTITDNTHSRGSMCVIS